jgi:Hint domain-containing protein
MNMHAPSVAVAGRPAFAQPLLPFPVGLLAGTIVLSRQGERPVEQIRAGDQLITRSNGFSNVTSVQEIHLQLPAVQISAGSLGDTRPDCDLIVAGSQRLLIRDWRAKALSGQSAALIEAARLIDGEFIRDLGLVDLTLFQLEFAGSEVIYANGLELECPAPACQPLQQTA